MSSNHVDLCFERKTFRDPFVSREIHDLYFCILSKYRKNVVAINAQEKILLNTPITVIADAFMQCAQWHKLQRRVSEDIIAHLQHIFNTDDARKDLFTKRHLKSCRISRRTHY